MNESNKNAKSCRGIQESDSIEAANESTGIRIQGLARGSKKLFFVINYRVYIDEPLID